MDSNFAVRAPINEFDRLYQTVTRVRDNQRIEYDAAQNLFSYKVRFDDLTGKMDNTVREADKKVVKFILNTLILTDTKDFDTIKVYSIIAKIQSPTFLKKVLLSSAKAQRLLIKLEEITKSIIPQEQQSFTASEINRCLNQASVPDS
jgi:hypothetical protein